jgi:broad-specificity NMP kinase
VTTGFFYTLDTTSKRIKPMITVVSGLPRSGTSMMMSMLKAGGVEVLTDNQREADEDNLHGYLEYEQVKQLDRDASWLGEAEGKAVKIISMLLRHLPPDHEYRIIFIHRDISEVLASQRKMMERRGEQPDKVPDDTMAALYGRHLSEVREWLSKQPNMRTLHVDYNETLRDPEPTADQVNEFLGGNLNKRAMVEVVSPELYRQRK